MTGEVYIAGHSLGAAEAYEYAYSRIKRGLRVDGIYAFAPPNPGDSILAQGLAAVPTIRPLRNRRDAVTALPLDIIWMDEEYVQPHAFEDINEAPAGHGLFADHSMSLYLAGAQKLHTRGLPVELGETAVEVARLYLDDTSGWDWINPVDGAYWAMKVMPSGAKLMIRRGTHTATDWIMDFNAIQISVLGARMSRGFWSGVGPVEPLLDAQLL